MSPSTARLAPLVLLLLPVQGCAHQSPVRAPTARERALIVATVRQTWSYESEPAAAGHDLALRRPHLRPLVLRARVARRDPRYASALVELRDSRGRRRGPPAVVVLKRSTAYGRHQWGYAVAGPGLDFPNSCGRRTLQALRDLMCPDAWLILGGRRPRLHAQSQYVQRVASSDVHSIDWRRVALPGGVCGSSRPIRPWRRAGSGGEAFIHADVDLLWWNPVWVYSWEKPVFGDLDGDGRDEAALSVVCTNGGGTAGGQLAFSEVVFRAVGRSLRVAGIVTPQQPLTPEAGHVPLLTTVAIRRGEVIAPEAWSGPHDGDCCASGLARTTWVYHGGRLRPLRTTIIRKPWLSPLQIEAMVGPPARDLNGAQDWPPLTRIAIKPGLFFQVGVENVSLGRVTKRNVRVTLEILGAGPTVSRTKTVSAIRAWGTQPTLRFSDLPRLEAGRATVEIDVHDKGAWPLRYRVVFTRR